MIHKQAIVIGGGISGIKTALDLYNGGVKDTLVLEARDRLGGRLLSIESGNKLCNYDLGASWFHDSLNNPLFDKAIEKKNISYYFDDGNHYYFSKDEQLISSWKFDPVVEEIISFIGLVYRQNPNKPDISVKDLCYEYLNLKHDSLNADQSGYAISVIRMWVELWQGESWDKVSGRYCFHDSEHLGRNVFVKNGYINVFNNELNELPESYQNHNIKLNSQVTEINYSNNNRIKLTTKTGEEYTCCYLVVTVPQSLLKITYANDPNYLKWTPPLPQNFLDILPHINFGSLGKVILEFDESFWPKNIDRFYALTNEHPSKDPKSWDYPTILINYQAIANTPSLIALIQNPLSNYIENIDAKDKTDKIWNLFKPIIEKISIIDSIPKPTKIYHTHWNNDKYSRGSYGTTLVGSVNPKVIADILCGGINNNIRFAGAETVDGSANGCAHGGWFSGQREAKYILDDVKSKRLSAKI